MIEGRLTSFQELTLMTSLLWQVTSDWLAAESCRHCVFWLALIELMHCYSNTFKQIYLFLIYFILFSTFILFLAVPRACGILVPGPRIEPVPSAVEAQSPNHWTSREVPPLTLLIFHADLCAVFGTSGTLLLLYELQSVYFSVVTGKGNLLRLDNFRSSLHYFS